MSIILENNVMIFSFFVFVLVMFTLAKVNEDKKSRKIEAADLKSTTLKKAITNSRLKSNRVSKFQSKELSSKKTETNSSSTPTFAYSARKVDGKISRLKKDELSAIEVKGELSGFQTHTSVKSISKNNMKNIRAVLLEIASNGKRGISLASITHDTGMSKVSASTTLNYLIKNNHVTSIKSSSGEKFYITKVGKKYCISRDFNMAAY